LIFVTKDPWLTKHPYLCGMAGLQTLMDTALAEIVIPTAEVPLWNGYLDDFHAGVPLLLSSRIRIDLQPAERGLVSLTEVLASKALPEKIASDVRDLVVDLRSDSSSLHRAVAWLLAKDGFMPQHPGPLHYLGWTVMARYLTRLIASFGQWRDEERWLRTYCPTCGASPGMAQLVGSDPARLRLLSCSCCATRWRYRRTGCPFCRTEDDERLAILTIEGEDALRIEYCKSCGGYLKTYSGEGNERLLLADWTSLHLDVIACDRGLKRYAGSLYQL
jgi:FdhE protein